MAEISPAVPLGFNREVGYYTAQTFDDLAEVDLAIGSLLAFLDNNEGDDPYGVEKELKAVAWEAVGVMRSETGLMNGIEVFRRISEEKASRLVAKNASDLVKVLEVKNLALNGEMVAQSALLRRECRGHHCRADHPRQDDANWLKWIVARKALDGSIQTHVETLQVRVDDFSSGLAC